MKSHFTHKAYYPWIVILLCAAFLFYKYVLQVSPSIMTDDLMREFHVNAAGLGNMAATFFYAYFATQVFVGVILDKYSLRVICALAIAVSALGAWLFSAADQLLYANIFRAMMGFGAAFATVCYMKCAAVWFKPERFAFIGGLLATAAMLGAVFGEAPLAYVVQTAGWRNTLVLSSVIGFVIAILFITLVRNQPKAGGPLHQESYAVTLRDVWNILSRKENWLLTFYSGLTFSPVAVFGGLWGNPFIQESYHLSRTMTASLISLAFLGLAVGGPVLGMVSDQLRRRRVVMFWGNMLAVLTLLMVMYIEHLPLWLLGALLFLFGFGIGAFMLGFAMGKELNKLALAATVIALINTGDAIFGAFTEPLVGTMLDWRWRGAIVDGVHYYSPADYRCALFILPLYLILATALLLFIRDSGPKQVLN